MEETLQRPEAQGLDLDLLWGMSCHDTGCLKVHGRLISTILHRLHVTLLSTPLGTLNPKPNYP